MNSKIRVEVITPSSVIISKDVDQVSLPTSTGEIGVLPGHISMVTELSSGVLKYSEQSDVSSIALHYGFAEIKDDKITLITEIAEPNEQIDLERAKKAQKNAENMLSSSFDSSSDSQKSLKKYHSKLLRSISRQQAYYSK